MITIFTCSIFGWFLLFKLSVCDQSPLKFSTCLVIFFIIYQPIFDQCPVLHPLKIPEKQRFSCVFRRYKMGALARNGLNTTFTSDLKDKKPE